MLGNSQTVPFCLLFSSMKLELCNDIIKSQHDHSNIFCPIQSQHPLHCRETFVLCQLCFLFDQSQYLLIRHPNIQMVHSCFCFAIH